jgi:N6-L-threonylcarbamoyladenine synthase
LEIALEFEEAVTDTLDSKLRKAIESTGAQSIIIGGGVSANTRIRAVFEKTAAKYNIPLFLPSTHISGDNALMIALAASLHPDRISDSIRAQGTKRLV